jgi:tetratricopeptide (TPR) repeat protein
VNPITQVGFDPGAADRWSETWFPLEGIGGLTDASRDGAMHVSVAGGSLNVSINAFGDVTDTLRVSSGDSVLASLPITFSALEPVERVVDLAGQTTFRVELRALGLDYASDRSARALARQFATDIAAREQIPRIDQLIFQARELVKGRRYHAAREAFEAALADEPWQRDALLGLADLDYRRGLYRAALARVTRVLQLDAYDAAANFVAGNLYRALGRTTDAREAYGWAARSMTYRSTAYVQLAELTLADEDYPEATRYAWLALDYDRYSIPARQVLAMIGRKRGDATLASSMREQLLELDPLHHFVAAEVYLAAPSTQSANSLTAVLRSEFPDQTILELAVDYVRRGASGDARALLRLGTQVVTNPLLRAWLAWLEDDATQLPRDVDLEFAFPFRQETIAVLDWAAEHDNHWSWSYLLALNLWARDRATEAASLLEPVGDGADYAPFYVSRAHLLQQVRQRDPEADLRRAVRLDSANRTLHIHVIQYLQGQGRWDDALAESSTARALFPDDFNLELLQVRSLVHLEQPADAIEILDATQVLPSENARASHRLYEQAHTLAALDAIDDGALEQARRHLGAALDWPERLGQGRPYEPEQRLVQYMLGSVELQLGKRPQARVAFEAVVDATGQTGASADRLDLLAIPSLVALGRTAEISAMWSDTETDVGRFGEELIRAMEGGEDPSEASMRLAAEHSGLFEDLLGRMLLRALAAG